MVLHKATTAYKLWHDWLKNFPKSSRFTLGARLDQLFLELLELLAVANYSPKDKKLGLAQAAIGKNDLLKFYLRLCWEMKLLDDSKFKNLALKTEEIGRLCWSWKTRLEKTSPPTARMEK
ncbi:MAG: four helix bundle protein [Candidatus Buchananbacteria bacterium]